MKYVNHSKPFLIIVMLLAGFLTSGCFSLSRFQKQLDNNDFEMARATLVKESAFGVTIPPNTDEDLVHARSIYQKAIEKSYLAQRDTWMAKGCPQSALRSLNAASDLCPWSSVIESAKADQAATLDRLDRLESSWTNRADPKTWQQAEDFFNIPRDLRTITREHPHLWRLVKSTEGILLSEAYLCVKDAPQGSSDFKMWSDRLSSAVSLSLPPIGFLELTSRVVAYKSEPLADSQAWLADLRAVEIAALNGRGSEWQEISDACRERHITWIRTDFLPTCADRLLSLQAIDELVVSESALREIGLAGEWRTATVSALKTRSQWLSGMGLESILAVVYDAVAIRLSESQKTYPTVAPKALASLRAAMPLHIGFRVEAPAKIDAKIADFVGGYLESIIRRRTKDYVVDPDKAVGVGENHWAEVRLDQIEYIFDEVNKLPLQQSQYLSHYEDVPNPRKRSLRNDVDFAQSQCDSAHQSLNYAISSYNINPSDWGLTNVNSARTRYNFAVSNYNNLVNLYNTTPATISRPVFIPYSFTEGRVRHGWIIGGSVTIDGKSHPLEALPWIESDWVRVGTRVSDVNPDYRSDDHLILDRSFDRCLVLLGQSLNRLCEELSPKLADLGHVPNERLSPQEQMMLGWLIHPWGDIPNEKVFSMWPSWIPRPDGTLIPKDFKTVVPEKILPRPTWPLPISPEVSVVSDLVMPTVCQIFSYDGDKIAGSGTATCINGTGDLLTCSHVLKGTKFSIVTLVDGVHNTFPAEIVYRDNRNDVAIIHAVGLMTKRWAAIRLDSLAVAGEPIFAIGFPGLENGQVAEHALTVGTVAVPRLEYGGSPRTMFDINISSGSSGGPIFSLKTGEIVGVITSVVSPNITSNFGRSGFAAFGVPGVDLSQILGLRYE